MFDLMGFFITNFDVKTVYEAGWSAAQAWMAVVSGAVLALAILIRAVQEQLAGGKGDYMKAIQDFVVYAILTSCLFLFVYLLIEFFNGIYGTLNASSAVSQMGKSLNKVFEYWSKSKFEFSLTDLANGFYGGFGFAVFILSYMVLVFVVFAMRIAHAILVSCAAIWAAVAIPMAPVNGLKSLQSLKVIVLVAFIWPIFDAFFMYLVSSVFTQGLEKAFDTNADTVTAGQMVFVLFIYSIINIFMVAACLAAPFVAQGIANGTGNVTGLLASFGGAGVAAGMIAAKYGADKVNAAGGAAGGFMKNKAGELGGSIKEKLGFSSSETPSASASLNKGAMAPEMPEPLATGAEQSEAATGKNAPTAQGATGAGVAEPSGGANPSDSATPIQSDGQTTTNGAQGAPSSNLNGSTNSGGAGASSGDAVASQSAQAGAEQPTAPTAQATEAGNSVASEAKTGGQESVTPITSDATMAGSAGSAAGAKAMNFDAQNTQIGEELAAQAEGGSKEEESLVSEQSKKEKQARRGAIINQQNKGRVK